MQSPSDAFTHLLRQSRLARFENKPKALELLHACHTLEAGNIGALSTLAKEFLELEQLDVSARLLSEALTLIEDTPNFVTSDEQATLQTRLGALYIRQGDLKNALRVLNAALVLSDNGYSALQLGNALRYLHEPQEARAHFTRAFNKAKASRDGTLAIAALCAEGELLIDETQAQAAVEHFGKALGITEFSGDEALTVAPLAGLAHAHVLWGNPSKALGLARRAQERAQRTRNPLGESRALLSQGVTFSAQQQLDNANNALSAALNLLETNTHRPLTLKILMTQLQLSPTAQLHAHATQLATSMQMPKEQTTLQALEF